MTVDPMQLAPLQAAHLLQTPMHDRDAWLTAIVAACDLLDRWRADHDLDLSLLRQRQADEPAGGPVSTPAPDDEHDWRPHVGLLNEVPRGPVVVRFRRGDTFEADAAQLNWQHLNDNHDIVAWRPA